MSLFCMRAQLCLVVAWTGCGLGLYLHVFFIDLYWNFINWTPHYDLPSLFAAGGMVGALVGMGFLATTPVSRWLRVVSGVGCTALLAVGAWLVSPEPVTTEGLLARVASSPAWYRVGRLLILAAPFGLWFLGGRGLARTRET